jgi:hypothetical protein
MSRLYYPKPYPLLSYSRLPPGLNLGVAETPTPPSGTAPTDPNIPPVAYLPPEIPIAPDFPAPAPLDASVKDYAEKVSKLIPADVVAAYLAVIGIVPAIKWVTAQPYFAWILFVFFTILTPIVSVQTKWDRGWFRVLGHFPA